MKKQGLKANSEQFQHLCKSLADKALILQSAEKKLHLYIEQCKQESEQEKKAIDMHNLTLQSLLYEKDYFAKEIFFCKEYKTP